MILLDKLYCVQTSSSGRDSHTALKMSFPRSQEFLFVFPSPLAGRWDVKLNLSFSHTEPPSPNPVITFHLPLIATTTAHPCPGARGEKFH